MPHVRDSRIFDLPQREIYALLMDIEAYPDFIPFVRQVKIISQVKNRQTVADIRIGTRGLDFSYRCLIEESLYDRIAVRDVSGPFSYLRCEMILKPLSARQTEVTYIFESQFRSRLMNRLADPVFNIVLKKTLGDVARYLRRRR